MTQASEGARNAARGFAAMDRERQREIARLGGKAAHASGHAHEFSTDEARAAGRKGGEAVSRDRAHMAQIGKRGGEARGQLQRARTKSRPASARGASDEHLTPS